MTCCDIFLKVFLLPESRGKPLILFRNPKANHRLDVWNPDKSCRSWDSLHIFTIWMFPKMGYIPQNGWFIMESPIKDGWFGGILPTIFGNTDINCWVEPGFLVAKGRETEKILSKGCVASEHGSGWFFVCIYYNYIYRHRKKPYKHR